MNGSDILLKMELADPRFVAAADKAAPAKKQPLVKWLALAACLCLFVGGYFILSGREAANDGVVLDYEGTEACYAVPQPGEYFCFVNVNDARRHYAGQNVSFLLAFDIWKDGGEENPVPLTDEERAAEYRRLSDLGYRLYEVEYWTYQSVDEIVYSTAVAGLFTEAELADLQINEDYGYSFFFLHNGDSSAVEFDEANALTGYQEYPDRSTE